MNPLEKVSESRVPGRGVGDLKCFWERKAGARKEEHSRDDVEWPPRTVCLKIAGEPTEDIRDLKKAGGERKLHQFNKSQQHLFKSISE